MGVFNGSSGSSAQRHGPHRTSSLTSIVLKSVIVRPDVPVFAEWSQIRVGARSKVDRSSPSPSLLHQGDELEHVET